MSRYYFDLREGDVVAPDEVGLELPDLRAAQEEAARSLADMVKDASRQITTSDIIGELSIEVRDQSGPVLEAKFVLAHRKRH